MFNFSSLNAVSADNVGNSYSFVGICDGELRLPQGCEAWAKSIAPDPEKNPDPEKKFAAMQAAFLSLYRTLRVYRQAKNTPLTSDRDSGQQGGKGGQELTLGSYEEEDGKIVPIIYYRHLDMLDCVLEAYDELAILSLAQRIGRSERLDCSKLHQHLDRATFLEDDSFVVDEMMLPRQQVSFEPVEIVQMYCFVFLEIKKWLGEAEGVTSDIRVLAEQFFEHHLATGDGLFEFGTWEATRDILSGRLEIIDQNTAFKDDAYHDFYDVLERFLLGNMQPSKDGPQWGISTFAPVWESMCLSYLIEDRLPEIAVCDASNLPDVLTDRLTLLTAKERSNKSDLTALLRVSERLSNVFNVNGTQLFPDCVLIRDPARDLEYARNSLYRAYGVTNLGDGDLSSKPNIPKVYVDIIKALKPPNGYDQNSAAGKLEKTFKTTPPNELTAFFLGRALCASFQSSKIHTEWHRETLCKELVTSKINSAFHLNFLRGMLWEVYFDKNDKLRGKSSLLSRENLHSYKLAMNRKLYIDKNTKINEIYNFFKLAEKVIKSDKFAQSTIVDFKYLTASYFHDPKNASEIRIRSVRKQFVYEYLLNKKLNPHENELDKQKERYSIGSEFWIPCFDEDRTKIELLVDEQFSGGSIPLRSLNVAALMDTYEKLAIKEM